MVLVMGVVPGASGQPFIYSTIDKVKELKKYLTENNLDLDIEVDGGINEETAKLSIDAGADILAIGSYLINSENQKETIRKIKDNY